MQIHWELLYVSEHEVNIRYYVKAKNQEIEIFRCFDLQKSDEIHKKINENVPIVELKKMMEIANSKSNGTIDISESPEQGELLLG